MMTTAVQIVIAAILNFLGMATEAQDIDVPVKAEIFVENRMDLPEEGKLCYTYLIIKEARDTY